MALETELKLRLSPGAAVRLLQHPLLAATPPQRLRLLNTYYDTPELDLLRRRMALRHRRKGWDWLLTVKTANPASGGLARRNEWEAPVAPGQFDFAHVDDKELRTWLEKRTPRLEAAFTTDFTRLAWIVEPEPGTRIEIALDRGSIQSKGQKEALVELELELLAGPETALFTLARALAAGLGQRQALHPVAASKAERGYALFTGRRAPPLKSRPIPLAPDLAPLAAFRSAALDCLQHLQANEAGAQQGDDVEYLHQARIAIRRLRSLFKLFAPALPEQFLARWTSPWRDLGRRLGQARNWDVFLNEILPPLAAAFPLAPEPARLASHASSRSQAAHLAVRRLLAAPAYSWLLLEFTGDLFNLAAPDDKAPVLADLATRRLTRRIRQACRLARNLAELDSAGRHRLRIAFKRLRYAIEFLAPEPSGKPTRRYHRALARLQEHLGRINDQATASEILAAQLPQRAGLIQGWLAGRSDLLLAELPDYLKDFLRQTAPWEKPRRADRQRRHKTATKAP